MTKAVLRVMDANLNRVREGFRVCEDISRFIKNNSKMTSQFKSARHELSRIILSGLVPSRELLSARESYRDVGKKSYIKNSKKVDEFSLMTANLKRVEEGLRVLEECSKIARPKAAPKFQALRFKIYELEKSVAKKF